MFDFSNLMETLTDNLMLIIIIVLLIMGWLAFFSVIISHFFGP